MRRLPVYFLIDVSESMVGEPIEQVQQGISTVMTALKTDPYALETVWVSIIAFAGKSKVITPLQDVITFYPPTIPIGSGTSLSSGLTTLMQAIDRDIVTTTFEKKGDWKPLVFLFTDGTPTDASEQAITQWNNHYRRKTNMVVISIGDRTNYALLGSLSENLLRFQDTDANAYSAFFKWVTASIKATSEHVSNHGMEVINLSKADPGVMERIDLTKQQVVPDDQYVVVHGKCSKTKQSYLVKYRQALQSPGIHDFQTRVYEIQGAYKIDADSYEALSSQAASSIKVSSSELQGNTDCPYCAQRFAMATCNCGKNHCIRGNGKNTCPWCGQTAYYRFSSRRFDINRTLG
ncbi:uncharacterized protein YegL [Chitinophaga skermanii]|uniref:Uncharacterized protein YegL n=1 Tax=Chitinophaga skermanii TaxID=331697 RepID=A0A327QY06_9BACT|nr:TerY-C metal binding domain-containing protein [Chitinophaga skermanii]RAJ08283.1 uncharacterized protein YegL [Chitinophaga skermanii]